MYRISKKIKMRKLRSYEVTIFCLYYATDTFEFINWNSRITANFMLIIILRKLFYKAFNRYQIINKYIFKIICTHY